MVQLFTIDNVGAMVARLDGKIETLLESDRHHAIQILDHESRIRELEAKPVVTTRMLAAGVLVITALVSVLPIINLLSIRGN